VRGRAVITWRAKWFLFGEPGSCERLWKQIALRRAEDLSQWDSFMVTPGARRAADTRAWSAKSTKVGTALRPEERPLSALEHIE